MKEVTLEANINPKNNYSPHSLFIAMQVGLGFGKLLTDQSCIARHWNNVTASLVFQDVNEW